MRLGLRANLAGWGTVLVSSHYHGVLASRYILGRLLYFSRLWNSMTKAVTAPSRGDRSKASKSSRPGGLNGARAYSYLFNFFRLLIDLYFLLLGHYIFLEDSQLHLNF